MSLYHTVGEFTVKTQGPGMMNEGQESEMQSIEEKCTEENNLQLHPAEVSFNTLDGVRRPLSLHVRNTSNHTL